MSSHSSLMMLLSKLAPWSLRTLASAAKIKMYPCHRNLATVCAIWSGVTYVIMCLVKWWQKAKAFTTCGGWCNSIVASMQVKSTWSSSKREVTRIACIGALTQTPSCWIHLSQPLITFYIHITMPGQQNQSYNRGSICLWIWCPMSLWHPFMDTTL